MKDWQKECWPRHVRLVPADDGRGYQYRPGIIRAFVADGTVDSRPSWENSPQVAMWMNEAKKGVWKRFREWLDK